MNEDHDDERLAIRDAWAELPPAHSAERDAACAECGHVRSSHQHGCHAQMGDLTCRCNGYVFPPGGPDA